MTSSHDSKPRGSLILIEGLDRSGKSTQCVKLASSLPNTTVVRFPDRSTGIGGLINTYLSQKPDTVANTNGNYDDTDDIDIDDLELQKRVILKTNHLLFSANRWECVPNIIKLLKQGTNVVLDRYVYSGIAYSYAANGLISKEMAELRKNNHANVGGKAFVSGSEKKLEGDDVPDWLYTSDLNLPAPDMVLFLTIDPENARMRAGFGDERYENVEMQERVRYAFNTLISNAHRHNPSFESNNSPWIEIKTDGLDIDQVHQQVKKTVENVLEHQVKGRDILKFERIL